MENTQPTIVPGVEAEEEAISFLDRVLEYEDVFYLDDSECRTPTSPDGPSSFSETPKVSSEDLRGTTFHVMNHLKGMF